MEENKQHELEQEENKQEEKNEVKTFSKEEVDKMLQVESDKRVTQALEKSKAKWEEEYKTKLESEKSEAEKLAAMTSEERFKSELEKERQQFLEERKQFNRERLENQAIKELASSNLPVEFSNYVMAETAENVSNNIKSFKTEWENALAKAVEDKLKGSTPSSSNKKQTVLNVTKEDFKKMNYHQKLEIQKSDPELYQQLRG